MTSEHPAEYAFAEFRLVPDEGALYRNEETIPLEPRPLRVLEYLVARCERVVPKEELLDRVWPDVFTTDGVLKKAISQIRRALGDDVSDPRFVETYHGRGYRFVAPVTIVAGSSTSDGRARPGNVPSRVSAFLGRDAALRDLGVFLGSTRALTLSGPGGIGKTSLAYELARTVQDRFVDGVWVVELGEVTDPSHVVSGLGSVLGLRQRADAPTSDGVVDALASSSTLLVFDNCEHVLDAVAALVTAILRRCPNVAVLTTSRAALGLPGEAVWSVPPLDGDDAEAVFTERARFARPGFVLNDANQESVHAVCARLEGNPLAIELAAARLRHLSLDELRERLDDRTDVLVGADRAAPARHKTLRATIEWSYALLDEAERSVLNRLSVFAGSWTLAGAECVAAGEPAARVDVLDVLARLVDKSLVAADTRSSVTKYGMLDSIRAFARERLAASGHEALAIAARRRWALALAQSFDETHFTPLEVLWLDRLAEEHVNVRAAWQEAADAGDAEACALFVGRLWLYWEARGHWSEALACLDVAMSALDGLEPAVAAGALYGAGMYACASARLDLSSERLGRSLEIMRRIAKPADIARAVRSVGTVYAMRGMFDEARAAMAESVEIFEGVGDPVRLAWAKGGVAWSAMLQGDLDEAAVNYEESASLLERAGVRRLLANAVHNLADIRRHMGDDVAAANLMARALELAREANERRLVARSLQILGLLFANAGDRAAAFDHLREAVALQRRLGDQADIALALETAAVVGSETDPQRTVTLAGAARAHRDATTAESGDWDMHGVGGPIRAAEAAVDPETRRDLERRGRAMTLDQAVALAFAPMDTRTNDG